MCRLEAERTMRRGLISRSKVELPDAVLDARLDRLRTAMPASGLDALMLYTDNTRPAAVSWLCGFVPYWSEALLVLPLAGDPVLVVALTFRVKPWIERTSRVADVIHTPRIGIEAARLVAATTADAAIGIVEFDRLPGGITEDLRETAPRVVLSDASELFAASRAKADPAEIALAMRAASIAKQALVRVEPRAGLGEIIAAVEGEARALGAEEVYIAVAPDLAHERRLVRPEHGTSDDYPELGDSFAVRASLAYKGSWVRCVRTVRRDEKTAARCDAALQEFAGAVARLPSAAGLSRCASFLVEGCRLAQPFEALMGSRVAAPRPLVAGALVSVQVCIEIEGWPILCGAPVLIGAPGEAAALLC
jgi:Creatinase/Prolidase N-terminal domain